jgi:hypothetical protein
MIAARSSVIAILQADVIRVVLTRFNQGSGSPPVCPGFSKNLVFWHISSATPLAIVVHTESLLL